MEAKGTGPSREWRRKEPAGSVAQVAPPEGAPIGGPACEKSKRRDRRRTHAGDATKQVTHVPAVRVLKSGPSSVKLVTVYRPRAKDGQATTPLRRISPPVVHLPTTPNGLPTASPRSMSPIPIPQQWQVDEMLARYCTSDAPAHLSSLPHQVEETRNLYNSLLAVVSDRAAVEEPSDRTVRGINNFLKSILFGRYIARDRDIIDFGGNRLQDLFKLKYVRPRSVMCIDVSERSLYEAERRWRREKFPFPATFVQDDFTSSRFLVERDLVVYKEYSDRPKGELKSCTIGSVLSTRGGDNLADVVSCQFAAHYAFYSRRAAHTFLDNVCRVLRPGGLFVGTAPQGEQVTRLLAGALRKGSRRVDTESFSMWLDDSHAVGEAAADAIAAQAHVPYWFHMKRTVEKCRQYTMPFKDLFNMCDKRGLRLLYMNNLRCAFETESINPKNAALMERMGIEKAPEDCDLAHLSLYCAFVFAKGK